MYSFYRAACVRFPFALSPKGATTKCKFMDSYEKPIPVVDWPSNAGSYSAVPVNLEDPRSSDPLVRINDFAIAGESYYFRHDRKNWPYNTKIDGSLQHAWCRRLVAQKLKQVNEFLNTEGVELYIWDAYRPIQCQVGLWNFFIALALTEMPDATESERMNFVLDYISDPTRFQVGDSTTWPTHITGAAVDLTLRDLHTRQLCKMGARFDEPSKMSHSDYYERRLLENPTREIEEICRNRRLLHFAMKQEGFVNYPKEFWHFDWGNQMYVHNLRLLSGEAPNAAWFGYIESPES